MKKIALVSAIALSGLLYTSANAQILQIGLNLGRHRPVVEASLATPGMAISYSNADEYYYLPDVDAYYCVPERVYYYNDGVNWVPAAYLPGEYRNYDWRSARHYEVHARRPFLNGNVYRERYNGHAYDWRRYNERAEVRRDERFNDRREFDNRNNRHEQPQFVRPNQYRGIEHANGRSNNYDNRNYGNEDNRGHRNDDNRGHNQSQYGNGHFADSHAQGGRHGFGRS